MVFGICTWNGVTSLGSHLLDLFLRGHISRFDCVIHLNKFPFLDNFGGACLVEFLFVPNHCIS